MREINYVKLKYGPFYKNGWLIANFVRLWVGIKQPVLPGLLPRRPACCELRYGWQPYPRRVTGNTANGPLNAAALTELQGLQLPSSC